MKKRDWNLEHAITDKIDDDKDRAEELEGGKSNEIS